MLQVDLVDQMDRDTDSVSPINSQSSIYSSESSQHIPESMQKSKHIPNTQPSNQKWDKNKETKPSNVCSPANPVQFNLCGDSSVPSPINTVPVPFSRSPNPNIHSRETESQNVSSLVLHNMLNQSNHVTGSGDHMAGSDVTLAAMAAGQRLEQMWKFIMQSWYVINCMSDRFNFQVNT